ncbi:MAG: hypothetical protein D6675_05460 [Gemmatimonadetes bacterium]|nr:MAG: hypothetical protein D6675_05460 [Gemmatimonadota bacterium]
MTELFFIASTPLHIIFSSLIADQWKADIGRSVPCILILTGPQKNIHPALFATSDWDEIHEEILFPRNKYLNWNWLRDARKLKENFPYTRRNTDTERIVFWSNDTQLNNQIIHRWIEPDKTYFIEEGLGTYIQRIKKEPYHKVIGRFLTDKLVFHYGLACYHYVLGKNKINDSSYVVYPDKFRKWAFFPNKPVHDLGNLIQKKIATKLTTWIDHLEALPTVDGKTALLLTQPLSADRGLTEQRELAIYANIVQRIQHELHVDTLFLKPHPRESSEKYTYFYDIAGFPIKLISQLKGLPVEILLKALSIDYVITLFSSTMLYASLFSPQTQVISAIKMAPEALTHDQGIIPIVEELFSETVLFWE